MIFTPNILLSKWAQLNGIQATRVEMELNYIEYVISATHREMWQNIGPIKASQADLASFALEVSKRLNLRYQSPPKPIHLSVCKREKKEQITTTDGVTAGNNESSGSSDMQQQQLQKTFDR
jgi:hypothetical protein